MARTRVPPKRASKSYLKKQCIKHGLKSSHEVMHVSQSCNVVSRSFKRHSTTTYTGTPDSDVVARHLEQFKYQPDKKQIILKKYEHLG